MSVYIFLDGKMTRAVGFFKLSYIKNVYIIFYYFFENQKEKIPLY